MDFAHSLWWWNLIKDYPYGVRHEGSTHAAVWLGICFGLLLPGSLMFSFVVFVQLTFLFRPSSWPKSLLRRSKKKSDVALMSINGNSLFFRQLDCCGSRIRVLVRSSLLEASGSEFRYREWKLIPRAKDLSRNMTFYVLLLQCTDAKSREVGQNHEINSLVLWHLLESNYERVFFRFYIFCCGFVNLICCHSWWWFLWCFNELSIRLGLGYGCISMARFMIFIMFLLMLLFLVM